MKHKKGQDSGSRSKEAIEELEGNLLGAARIGLLWCLESILRENSSCVNVNSLCNTCIAKGEAEEEGEEEKEEEEEGQTLEPMFPLP